MSCDDSAGLCHGLACEDKAVRQRCLLFDSKTRLIDCAAALDCEAFFADRPPQSQVRACPCPQQVPQTTGLWSSLSWVGLVALVLLLAGFAWAVVEHNEASAEAAASASAEGS